MNPIIPLFTPAPLELLPDRLFEVTAYGQRYACDAKGHGLYVRMDDGGWSILTYSPRFATRRQLESYVRRECSPVATRRDGAP